MSSSEREDFLKWHDARTNDTNYNFKDEKKAYCRSDVDILHKCILYSKDCLLNPQVLIHLSPVLARPKQLCH